jgi:hypothetical protein
MKELLREFNPSLARDVSQGRNTMLRDLRMLFATKEKHISNLMIKAQTRINISFDLWTSPNHKAIISIFGHFLDQEYRFKNVLLAFRAQLGSHSGENIAQTVGDVIKKWGIEQKIGVSVTDNATNNDRCLKALFPTFDALITETDIKARRMRCFGHILNLTAQAFLLGLDANAFEQDSQIFGIRGQQEEDLAHWRAKGPIGKLHNIVRFIRSSPQRIEAFKKHARELEVSLEGYLLSESQLGNLGSFRTTLRGGIRPT